MALSTVTTRPYNAEASLTDLGAGLTPIDDFFVRSNFIAPRIDTSAWMLRIGGLVREPLEIDLAALQSLPRAARRITLECAGNGRRLMVPQPGGTPWHLGALGTALFTGVALRDVLALAGPRDDAVECIFTGADQGVVDGAGHIRFQRSLPVDVALSAEPLIVWSMNDAPLTMDHGAPVRLVVPNYYAVASVKWLVAIDVVDRPFDGHFQSDRYMYRVPDRVPVPVTMMHVRSLITSHAPDARIVAGEHTIEGIAWSGAGTIARVDVATGPTGPWLPATLDAAQDPGAAARWRVRVTLTEGVHTLRARATDSSGETQPLTPRWNELGYGNNVVQSIDVTALPLLTTPAA